MKAEQLRYHFTGIFNFKLLSFHFQIPVEQLSAAVFPPAVNATSCCRAPTGAPTSPLLIAGAVLPQMLIPAVAEEHLLLAKGVNSG